MRTKKKASQAPSIEKQPQNKLRVLTTNDNATFKIMDSVLMKYSTTIRGMLEDEKNEEDIKLLEVDSEAMKYLVKFLELHEDKEPEKMYYPLKSNQDIKLVMEEKDADLVHEVMNSKDDDLALFKKVLDATSYLQIEDFKKRLMAGLTIKLLKSTVDELKEEYDIK